MFIIQFKEEPLSVFKNRLTAFVKDSCSQLKICDVNGYISQKVAEKKNEIVILHQRAKNEIKQLLGTSNDNIFCEEFSVLLKSFSWLNFCRLSFLISRYIFSAALAQLFL